MSERNDGGSAFPQVRTNYDWDTHEYTRNIYSEGGMSLRDYFAGQALAGLCASLAEGRAQDIRSGTVKGARDAAAAYALADAMLAERSK